MKNAPILNRSIINILTRLRENETSINVGLCRIIDDGIHVYSNMQYAIHDFFHTWKHFSSDYSYPVPCPNNHLSPGEAYQELEKYSGQYGALRLDLLEHIIVECERQNEILLNVSDEVINELANLHKKYYSEPIEKDETDVKLFLEKWLTKESIDVLIELFTKGYLFPINQDETTISDDIHRVFMSIGRIIQ
ncbi:hypothetical protein VmeM32_00244 [Vibrio phage vB_VmeM-32]|nr:hypothetical protein VmeM32_00244 [Vibrio phage vB_VmeM-32]